MSSTSRYLVTGGAGFIGSHLCQALLANNHHVSVIDDLSTGRLENIAALKSHPNFHFARATVENQVVLDRLSSEADVVVHLAAAVGVKRIVERPVQTIEANVGGTECVLDAALRYGCRVLIASTSEVYGKGSKIPFSEDDDVVLGPTSRSRWAYATSKMIDEFLGLAYGREYGLPVVISRLFNTVGPRQRSRYGMVLPRFVKQALRGEAITVYGDGSQQRCFCDVADVVRAIIGLAEHADASGHVFNVGGTESITIQGLAERVRDLVGSTSDIIHIPYDEAYAPGFEDMKWREPDITRIRKMLAWEPSISLDETLQRTADYVRTVPLERRRDARRIADSARTSATTSRRGQSR